MSDTIFCQICGKLKSECECGNGGDKMENIEVEKQKPYKFFKETGDFGVEGKGKRITFPMEERLYFLDLKRKNSSLSFPDLYKLFSVIFPETNINKLRTFSYRFDNGLLDSAIKDMIEFKFPFLNPDDYVSSNVGKIIKTVDERVKYVYYKKSTGKYAIERTNSEYVQVYFGTYNSHEEAIAVLEELENNDWDGSKCPNCTVDNSLEKLDKYPLIQKQDGTVDVFAHLIRLQQQSEKEKGVPTSLDKLITMAVLLMENTLRRGSDETPLYDLECDFDANFSPYILDVLYELN